VPSKIESLSRVESIATGQNWTSAAVDTAGWLFTWGQASFVDEEDDSHEEEPVVTEGPGGLGYELDAETEYQATPKRVDALSHSCVVAVALGWGFTLAVTDTGAVFSFGFSTDGGLGHGSSDSEVLPRRIEALTETGRRFVAVAAGNLNAFALAEGGELYGWGDGRANGHGQHQRTPHRLPIFYHTRIKLVNAGECSACAVTETGELFTWGDHNGDDGDDEGSLGHVAEWPHKQPGRVVRLRGVEVAAVSICGSHTLAADVDGVVWAFGRFETLGLGFWGPLPAVPVRTPTPIPTLRVRVLNSP